MKQFAIYSKYLNAPIYKLYSYERLRYTGDWQSILHSHSYMEILFITDGEGTFKTPEKETHIRKGEIIIINPTSLHTLLSHPTNHLEYAAFSIENTVFMHEKYDKQQDVFIYDFSRDFEELFDVLRVIEREESERRQFWQLAINNETNKLMLFILRNTSLESHLYTPEEKSGPLLAIHRYLTSRYQEDITLEKLSEIFFLNKYYIAHAFKERYGKSIITLLKEIRCNEAEELLKSTDLSISEVATQVGFNSVSYFSSTYKKIKGETPQQTKKTF